MTNEFKYEIEKANRETFRKLESKTLSKADIAFEGRLVLMRLRKVYQENVGSPDPTLAALGGTYWLGYVHGAEEMLSDLLGSSVDLRYDPDTDAYTFELDE